MRTHYLLRLIVLALLSVSTLAAAETNVRKRQFVPREELSRVYPGRVFVGDVRVERGVSIAAGARLVQSGSKPLYVLGLTFVDRGTVTQSGDKPMVLLHSTTGPDSAVQGFGVIAHSQALGLTSLAGGRLDRTYSTGSVSALAGRLNRSTVRGIVVGDVDATPGSDIGGIVLGRASIRGVSVQGILIGNTQGPKAQLGAPIGLGQVGSVEPVQVERVNGSVMLVKPLESRYGLYAAQLVVNGRRSNFVSPAPIKFTQ